MPLIHSFTTHNPQKGLPNRGGTRIGSSYPEGNFEGNQLLGGSMSLSPLNQIPANDLHVSNATNFHHSFPWLQCNLA